MSSRDRRMKTFVRNGTAMFGLGIVVVMLLVAVFANGIGGFDPAMRVDPDAMDIFKRPPSLEHPLGTDQNGFDVFSRLVHGARTSLITAFASIGLALLVGIPLGALAGYRGACSTV